MTKTSAASESAISTLAQHTPGPWIDGPTGPVMTQKYTQPFAVAEDGAANLICGCFGDVRGGKEVAQANARLIAAAPDMLKALRLVERHHMASPHIGLIRAAIAKATGGRETDAAAQHGTEEA